jgi:hypothetical protein
MRKLIFACTVAVAAAIVWFEFVASANVKAAIQNLLSLAGSGGGSS